MCVCVCLYNYITVSISNNFRFLSSLALTKKLESFDHAISEIPFLKTKLL